MNFSPDQLERYRRSARNREAARKEKLATRRERAWDLAYQAAEILKREFGTSRVVLFGSLLHPELYHARSDVDLVGWDVQNYFREVAHMLDLDPEYEFDLIPFEDASPRVLELIHQEGIDL
jgi:predicted nucleotidyltransferase